MDEAEQFERHVIPEPNSGCWLWTAGALPTGYGSLNWRGKNRLAHRVSYEIHCGEIPHGLHVLHSCDNPCCVNPDHLRPGTDADNIADMIARGRGNPAIGDRNANNKLTPDQVRRIRSAKGQPTAVSRAFGVSEATVRDIRAGRTWSHLS